MEKAERTTLSIVIPVHNSAAHLPKVIHALRNGMAPGDELTAVDDRSTDGSPDLCRSLGVNTIPSDRPAGAAGTRNCGAFRSGGEWILFVDSDAVPPRGWREALMRGADGVHAMQAVYARSAPGGSASTFYKNYYYHYTFTRRIRGRYIPGCGTFFFAVRRDVFLSLNGFDERMAGATVEDADFAARLTAAGGRILLLPGLEILHLREYTLGGLLRYDWILAGAKARYMMRRDRSHGRLSLSMAGASEMLPFAVAAASIWLVPAGLALAVCGVGWWPLTILAGILGVVASQGLFWLSCVREAGFRGLRACLVEIADLFILAPAALTGFACSLAGKRY